MQQEKVLQGKEEEAASAERKAALLSQVRGEGEKRKRERGRWRSEREVKMLAERGREGERERVRLALSSADGGGGGRKGGDGEEGECRQWVGVGCELGLGRAGGVVSLE
eukprot:1310807-Rhodomonas_salina.1